MPSISLNNCPIANIKLEKDLNTYNISVKSGVYFEFDYSKVSNGLHRHDCHELVFVLDGRGEFHYEGKNFLLHKGGIFIAEPYKTHEIHINPSEKLSLIYFMISIRKRGTNLHLSHEEKILSLFEQSHRNAIDRQVHLMSYIGFFEEYRNIYAQGEDRWFIKNLENFIFHCMESLLETPPETEHTEDLTGDTLDRALTYIYKNLSRKITADDISQGISTSKRNLYRLFHNKMHRPVHDYINECKISLAMNYLDMNCSVSETAALTGFEDLPRFSTLFKKYTGLSPREYRKHHNKTPAGYGRRLL